MKHVPCSLAKSTSRSLARSKGSQPVVSRSPLSPASLSRLSLSPLSLATLSLALSPGEGSPAVDGDNVLIVPVQEGHCL